MRVSVVSTLYRSAPYLEDFTQRVAAAVSEVDPDFELVLVDDGSPDESAKIARGLLVGAHRVRLVSLSRNFGHFPAIMAGLQHARGDLVFLIDCDLEEPPELFRDLYETMLSAPADDPIDLAYAVQMRRKGQWLERVTGALFYRLFNVLSDVHVPPNMLMARLMTRRFVDALLRHRERELYLSGITALTGFRQVPVPAQKSHKGTSSYSLGKKIALTGRAMAAFTDRPLSAIFMLGAAISLLAFTGIVALIVSVVGFGAHYLVGWASLALLVTFFGGMTLASIGLVGFYLGRVFVEVKARPTIVKQVEESRLLDEEDLLSSVATTREG